MMEVLEEKAGSPRGVNNEYGIASALLYSNTVYGVCSMILCNLCHWLITNLVDYRHSVPRNTTQDRGRKGVTKNSGWQRVCMLIKKTTPYSGKILLEVGCKVIQWGRKSRLLLNRLLGGLFLLCTESTEYFQKKEKERRDNPRNKIAGERTNPVRET